MTHTCKSCGNTFTGNFCNECGEKVLQPADRSFKTFLNTVITAITFADSSLPITIWRVITRPGFLTTEFADGRRVKYLKPLSLFLVLNLVYFFFPVIQLFNASIHTQLLSPLAHWYQHIIAHKITSMGLDLASFELIYNIKTVGLAKLMVMIFVVIASLPLNLLYRKRGRFFTDHIDFMIELACFNLIVNAITLSLVALTGLGKYLSEHALTVIFITTNFYFLVRACHRFYQERGVLLVLKSALVIVGLKLALEVYRAILFFVTLASL